MARTTLTQNKNFLQPTGFRISIDHTRFGNVQFFAQSISHPGASANAVEIAAPRVSSIPFSPSKITYSDLTVMIILDEDMQSYTELQDWMESLVNEPEVRPRQRVQSPSLQESYADITVTILTSHNNANLRIKYNDCIITNLGQVEMTANQQDVTFITFAANFKFRDFEIIRV
jgi:hypothetical protein